VTVAAGAEITFIASAHEGDELLATAKVRTRFGRSGVYDVRVTRGGEVIAEFRGHSRTLRTVKTPLNAGATSTTRTPRTSTGQEAE
jgi:acyl-CoA thioesterase